MAETVFAKILRGEIPSHHVYEDEHVFAFLDVNPLSRGHLLVIPREPAATLDQLSAESAAAMNLIAPSTGVCLATLFLAWRLMFCHSRSPSFKAVPMAS